MRRDLGPGLDLDQGQDPVPETQDLIHQYPGNPYLRVKMNLSLRCKYFSVVFEYYLCDELSKLTYIRTKIFIFRFVDQIVENIIGI